MDLKDRINKHLNFPKRGVVFRDVGPLLRDPQAMSLALDEFQRHFHARGYDVLAGIESRGFLVAAALAVRCGKGMIMLRKAGKLPGKTRRASYDVEYGKDVMEVQVGAVKAGERVLICDDLLATGGTAKAAAKLVERLGGTVAGFAFMVELTNLGGADRVSQYKRLSLVRY